MAKRSIIVCDWDKFDEEFEAMEQRFQRLRDKVNETFEGRKSSARLGSNNKPNQRLSSGQSGQIARGARKHMDNESRLANRIPALNRTRPGKALRSSYKRVSINETYAGNGTPPPLDFLCLYVDESDPQLARANRLRIELEDARHAFHRSIPGTGSNNQMYWSIDRIYGEISRIISQARAEGDIGKAVEWEQKRSNLEQAHRKYKDAERAVIEYERSI